MACTGSPTTRLLFLLTVAAVAFAGERRYARVGEFQGAPEVQIHPYDPWIPAVRNLPLIEFSRIRSAPADRIEIQLEDGSVFRLAGDSLVEISDYACLSTGQRLTLLTVDHGILYFTGEPLARDTVSLAVPGFQLTLRDGSRIRLEAAPLSSSAALLEGTVRFTTPNAELDLRAGQFATVTAGHTGRFTLQQEIPKIESDNWSEGRDQATARTTTSSYFALPYGASDLDHAGAWIATPQSGGAVWKPRTDDTWRPFRDGQWIWYDESGYTWVGAEPWGWLPYHYGRWIQDSSLGWVWSPDRRAEPIYKPGETYWLRGANHIAWGPLAPAETWTGAVRPQLYAPANTTIAKFAAGQTEIDSANLEPRFASQPAELLATMQFTVAPISPPLAAARLEVQAPALRTMNDAVPTISSVAPEVPATAYQADATPPAPLSLRPPDTSTAPPAAVSQADYVEAPEPVDTYYPAPLYSGIVVIDPPIQDDHGGGYRIDHHEPTSVATHQNPPETPPRELPGQRFPRQPNPQPPEPRHEDRLVDRADSKSPDKN